MKRAVIASTKSARFVVDTGWPLMVRAEECCRPPHEDRSFWHSAGDVMIEDLHKAAEHGMTVRWRNLRRTCWTGKPHGVELSGAQVAELLVAMDAVLECGRAPRTPHWLGTPPAPSPAHGTTDGGGETEGG